MATRHDEIATAIDRIVPDDRLLLDTIKAALHEIIVAVPDATTTQAYAAVVDLMRTRNEPIEAEQHGQEANQRDQKLLDLLISTPGLSIAQMATKLGWFYADGRPNKSAVQHRLKGLFDAGLVKKGAGGTWLAIQKASVGVV
jgi:hypothetical protein